MLTAIQIGNFKAFAETQRIPIRPLTLIYGANSSGKSSILHSLILARHAADTGELDVHRTNLGGEAVDLGGFRQFIHRRELSHRLEWSAELNTISLEGRLKELLAPAKKIMVSIDIGIALDDQGRSLVGAIPEVHGYEMLSDGKSLLRMSKRRDGSLKMDRLELDNPILREVLRAIVESSTTTESLNASEYAGLKEAISGIVPDLVASVGKFLPEGLIKTDFFNPGAQLSLFPVSKGRRQEDLGAAVRFFFPRTIDELIRGISNSVESELFRLQYLGPLRSYPPRHLAFAQHHDQNWFAGGGYAWDVVRRNTYVRDQVNTWLGAKARLQTPYELKIRELISDLTIEEELPTDIQKIVHDAFRDFLKSTPEGGGEGDPIGIIVDEIFTDQNIDSPDTISPDIESIVSRFVNSEELATKITQKLIQTRDEGLQELILVDKRSNTSVSHRDVGIGVSQVLPVLVGAYASQSQIIAIEQPEIHLHPALQADLGDVFLQSALGENKNRFLIETHSEHLLLRIMRRMRETASGKLPEGCLPVRPEDVMVLFVEPDGSRSIVREMPLNENGELIKAWPGGFFEEGLREIF